MSSVLHLLAMLQKSKFPYNDVLMSEIASQITSVPTVCSTIYSGADQRQHQRSASLAFVQGIHRWPVNSPHKRPVTRKKFPFDDVIRWWFACREIRKSSHAVVNKTISRGRSYFHHVHGVITINSSENICILMPKIRKMANPRHPIAPWFVGVSYNRHLHLYDVPVRSFFLFCFCFYLSMLFLWSIIWYWVYYGAWGQWRPRRTLHIY